MNYINNSSFIINADDFGMNKRVNEAILYSLLNGVCSTTTILANMEGYEDACNIIKKYDLSKKIGIHINLTEGSPLTSGIKSDLLFCDENGHFKFKKNIKRIYKVSDKTRKNVYDEISAQIERCVSDGIKLYHADSHNHMHEEPGLMFIFLKVLKKHKIPVLRKVKNMGYQSTYTKKIFRIFYNKIIDLNNLSGSEYFGSIDNYLFSKNKIKNNSVVEIMVHPGCICNNIVYDVFDNKNLSSDILSITGKNVITDYYSLKT
jgi:hypothetical protein